METHNVQSSISWLLIRASLIAKQRLLKLSEQHDLSLMQAVTLCLLEPNESVATSLISDVLSCDPSNVTGIVERLAAGAYIERRECDTDRRVKTINLTDRGETLRRELILSITESDAENIKGLTDEETQTLKRLLKKTLPQHSAAKHYPVMSRQPVTA